MNVEKREKKIVIIAGPNGSGKTTFAMEYLPNEAGCPVFVNADLIANGLAPFMPEAVAIRVGTIDAGGNQIPCGKKRKLCTTFIIPINSLLIFGYFMTIPGKHLSR